MKKLDASDEAKIDASYAQDPTKRSQINYSKVHSLDLDPRCQAKRTASGVKGTHIFVINVLPKTHRAGLQETRPL